MPLVSRDAPDTDFTADVLIIGAGASGLTAALAAASACFMSSALPR